MLVSSHYQYCHHPRNFEEGSTLALRPSPLAELLAYVLDPWLLDHVDEAGNDEDDQAI